MLINIRVPVQFCADSLDANNVSVTPYSNLGTIESKKEDRIWKKPITVHDLSSSRRRLPARRRPGPAQATQPVFGASRWSPCHMLGRRRVASLVQGLGWKADLNLHAVLAGLPAQTSLQEPTVERPSMRCAGKTKNNFRKEDHEGASFTCPSACRRTGLEVGVWCRVQVVDFGLPAIQEVETLDRIEALSSTDK